MRRCAWPLAELQAHLLAGILLGLAHLAGVWQIKSARVDSNFVVYAALYACWLVARKYLAHARCVAQVFNFGGDHFGGMSFEPSMGPPGYLRTLNAERRPYRTLDGHVCVIIYTDGHWKRFMALIGKSAQFESDPRLRDIGARTVHASELYGLISDQMPLRTTAQWLADLDAADIPAAQLHTLDSLFDDPHLLATGTIAEADHPTEGRIREVRPPAGWSLTPPVIRRRAPRFGQDSEAVLRDAGLASSEISQLIATGATRVATTP